MKKLAAILASALCVASAVRADIPTGNPEDRIRQYAVRTLNVVLRDIDAMEKIAVADGPEKETQAAAKAALKTKVENQISALSASARKYFREQAAEQEAILQARLDSTKDPAEKGKISGQLKPYQLLRDHFLQAALDSADGMADARQTETARFPMAMAALAMALAFASAGIIYARRNS